MTDCIPLLDVRDIAKSYEIRRGIFPRVVGQLKAVDRVSFALQPREVLGIAGESGSGKTTLGRLILRLVDPTAGQVLFRGQEVTRMSRPELRLFRQRAQIVFQDPFGSLDPHMRIVDIVGEPLEIQGLVTGARARRDRVGQLLETVALGSEFLDRRPHELSGGQRQRVGIARALSVKPELLIADEPVSALDVSIQAQILNLLDDLKQRLGLTMLFISHDLAVMDYLCDRIAVLYLGRIMEIGPKRNLLANARHPYTRALVSAVPSPGPRRGRRIVLSGDVPNPVNPPSGCAFRTRCPYALADCARERPPLRQVAAQHHTACIRDDLPDLRSSAPIQPEFAK
jgi:oligopeptide/dipeptide ABC transporter ATP-binding protein